MTNEFYDCFALCWGIILVFYGCRVAWKFLALQQVLSRRIGWNVLAQAYLGACAVTFSAGAMCGCLADWPEWVRDGMRLTMYGVPLATIYHLSNRLD